MNRQGKMETIGKVLSITLLTIFGSAAATVYLVDSDIFHSTLGKPEPVYTSDVKEQEKPADSYNATYRRERERINYADAEAEGYEAPEYTDVKPIWGQSYDSNPDSSYGSEERARELARNNSTESIIQNMDYWNVQYSNAVSAGSQASADNALRNYSEYKKALDIKQSGK
jgi:hypothetical protein